MLKRNFRYLLLAIILLLGIHLYNCEDDLDLSIEDDNSDLNRNVKKFDDDEFDDPILLKKQNIQENKKQNVKLNQQEQVPASPLAEFHSGEKNLYLAYYEIVMFLFVVAFIMCIFFGKSKNEKLAQKWYNANAAFLEDNYAHIGVNAEYNSNQTAAPMLKESYNNFKFYASGRKFIKWNLVTMDFKRRQDLVSLATSLFLFNEKDRITFEISMIPPNELPVVTCLCKKKDVKVMKKNYPDIDYFTKPYNPSFMSEQLVFLTEDYETFEMMFSDKEFLNLYLKVQPYIDIIYYTDRQTYTKEENSIFFSFDLKVSQRNIEQVFVNINLFVHLFIDILCSSRISTSHKRESEKTRTEFDRIRAKELQEKNAEEMRQKKTDKLNAQYSKKNLTVEQAQKLEEKNKKEQLKEQKKKHMKVVKK